MNPLYSLPNDMDVHLKAANFSDYKPESLHDPTNTESIPKPDSDVPDPEAVTTKSKRTRATPEQLAFLEASFQKNASPNCKIREVIAQRIGMPERSIQVWFQNRRAKVKVAQRKAQYALREEALHHHFMAARGRIGFGELPCLENPSFPGIASPYLNDFNSSPLPGGGATFSPYAGSSPFFDVGSPGFSSPNPAGSYGGGWSGPQTISRGIFPCSLLSIGNWHRRAVVVEDMVCGFSLDKNQMAWIVGEQNIKFRISFPFRNISGIELAFTDPVDAELRINLNQVPDFAVFSTPGQWVPCADFTENQQATQCLRHVIKGEAQGLRVQVLGLLHLSQELSTVARILGISSASQSAAQLEARRRQSISIVNSQGLLPENLGPTAGCGLSMPFDPQYMANLALDRAKNRSLSLPTLPQQQLNLGETSVAYQPGQVTIDPSTSLNNATFPDLINLGFSNFYSALADTQSYGQFPQELPASAFQTPVLPHHFEAEPGFGQPFDSQLQNPPQSSFACSQSSQFGLASESGARADGTSSINFTSIPSLAPQSHDLHAPLP